MNVNTTQTQTRTAQHPAFRTLDEEVSVSGLRVGGQLPDWLAGTLIRMTPASLDVAAARSAIGSPAPAGS